MKMSEVTVRRMVEETFGHELSQVEIDQLLPHVLRQLESNRELQELDLGGEDPHTTHYIRDRRLVP